MIDAALLLKDLKPLLKVLVADIRSRADSTTLTEALKAEWQGAIDAGRTAQAYTVWLDDEVTQSAVHWILACVFLRFVEDNGLVERPWLSGPGDRLERARDRHESWFREKPHSEERDFLLACFEESAALPGMGALFDRKHNPLWHLQVSGDGAIALRQFWQKQNSETGELRHDFHDPARGTRFLGDLYQNLSEDARKRYALLQTPEFVEEFILEHTLDRAMQEFKLDEVKIIDPTCGSGHFLLGAFKKLFDARMWVEPGRNPYHAAQEALSAVCGVDLNPFAVAIAKFRLLMAALEACGVAKLTNAPNFEFQLATGDSLLHGKRFMGGTAMWQLSLNPENGITHVTSAEDRDTLEKILGRQYHAVVGNPPYIAVKDTALSNAYRSRYHGTCHGKYSLGVPFTERFFDLALDGMNGGFVGLITANSFMKREFGKKLIKNFFRRVDLTHVVDTAGAYIPGHGTPTVILFGCNRAPVASDVRVVMGTAGEPARPENPAKGQVWLSILNYINQPGSSNKFVESIDLARTKLFIHPWNIGGGGQSELKILVESAGKTLKKITKDIGFASFPGLDDPFFIDRKTLQRFGIPTSYIKTLVHGEAVRDWGIRDEMQALAPYDHDHTLVESDISSVSAHHLWHFRTLLRGTVSFGGLTKADLGQPWWGWYRWLPRRYSRPLSITFAFVATHNHFVLDRGGNVFNRSAPVIKLPAEASEKDHLELVGLLNSSTACFWMKQIFHNKGSTVDDRGARQRTSPFEDFYEFAGTGLQDFPLAFPAPLDLTYELDGLAQDLSTSLPQSIVNRRIPSRLDLDNAKDRVRSIRRRMISLQEELDWRCYRLHGVSDASLASDLEWPSTDLGNLPEIFLGERAFEIVMARKMDEGEFETTWFERHRSKPIVQLPAHWPQEYRRIVERRIDMIESDRWIELIERPEYKRRWQWQPWKEQEQAALKTWLLDRLEDPRYWSGEPQFRTIVALTDFVRRDADFMHMAELYTGRPDFYLQRLLTDLIMPESVPYLPVLRYSIDGLRKREAWEETWAKQRKEDAIDARTSLSDADPQHLSAQEARNLKVADIGAIPVPPKYIKPDFLTNDFWRLRGGLDVPKERFISYPDASPDSDGTLLVAWAGYDHLQQARALAVHYLAMRDEEGWSKDRLIPLLSGLAELLPWLQQWHSAHDPEYSGSPAEFYAGFLDQQARALGETVEAIRTWAPPPKAKASRGRRTSRPEAAE